jgi:quinol monooxygenase YgiN
MLAAHVASQGGTSVDQIQVTATFPSITPDNLAEFKALAGDALKIALDEPGLLQYDWFFNADESTCVVRETFESSEAVLAHIAAVGAILGPVVELGGGLELEFFGSPSEQVLQALEAFRPTVSSYFQGK